MKIPYFCCIGAELKRYEKDFDFMNQVYLYKIPTDDTLEEVLAQDYFLAIADSVLQDDLLYIYEPTAQVLHTCRFNKQAGHITAVQLANNVPGLTPNRVLISDSTGHITAGDVTLEYLKNKVNLDGTSVMTGPLKFRAGSFSGAIAGGLGDGISVYKIKADGSIDSEVASLTKTNGFTPGTTNTQNIGSPTLKWKDAHVARVITAVINNGFDIAVPVTNTPDTLALKSEVDNAANSGRMITNQGVWFAKMYAASVVPTGAEYDGTNYADFSQTDSGGNPVIKIYTGASGAWTLTDTITPPATYDGYVPVTKKIWDIVDQVGQQGGRILWNHQSKEFTPFPSIVSFEDAALTGTPTAPLPTSDSPNNQIATKEYVDNASPSGVYHPGLFAHEWDDHIRYDVQWLRADTFSWQRGAVYEAAYNHLVADIDGKTLQSETVAGITIQFYLADDKHKICPASEASNVAAIYSKTGESWYYILDTVNERFKLPRRHSNRIVESVINSDGSWYRLYSDGWVEQGGIVDTPTADNIYSVSMPIEMSDANYLPQITTTTGNVYAVIASVYTGNAITTTGFSFRLSHKYNSAGTPTQTVWQVSGQSAIDMSSFQDGEKYLYFYMGQFTQTAIENTAGINTELFNDKADITAVAGLAAPDYLNITSLSNLDSYQQIQEDGYIYVEGAGGGNWNTIGIHISTNGTTSTLQITQANLYSVRLFVPVSKGVYVKRYDSYTTAIKFIPCKGNS